MCQLYLNKAGGITQLEQFFKSISVIPAKYPLVLIVTTAMLDIWIKNENGIYLGVNIGSKASFDIPLML